jgi:hypothetical protein
MRTLLRRSFIALAFLSACAQQDDAAPADDSDLATAKVGNSMQARIVHRMPHGSTSFASVRTLPNAVCQLHGNDEVADASSGLRVYADDDGIARVQLDHLDSSVTHGELRLDCGDDRGASASHVIEVVIDDNAQAQAPAKSNRVGKPTLPKLDVPATSLSDAEIYQRHYPPRPNPTTSPSDYASWVDLVSSEPTDMTPHIVKEADRYHASATSGNWSGYVVTSPGSAPIYAYVYGEWNVPRAYAESGFYSSDHSSFWVGIDGFGSNDVVQDGTDSNTFTLFWIGTSSYDGWVEWYPLSSQVVSNFPVNPGDRLHAWTWMTDASGNYTANPTVGNFYMWNSTQGYYVRYSINTPSGASFSGHQAEWVMERPTVGGSVASLANYSYAQMTNAYVYDLWGGLHYYGGDSSNTSWNVTMTGNGGAALSTVAPVSYNTMAFTWHGHN